MSWSALTEAELLQEFSSPAEQAALQALAGASDSIPQILARTVNQVRGYIIAGSNRLGLDNTIPDQLRPETIALARWRWLIGFPAFKALQTPERKQAADEAYETLKAIAKGDIKIELPTTALDTAAPGNAVQVARANQRDSTTGKSALNAPDGKLDGLL